MRKLKIVLELTEEDILELHNILATRRSTVMDEDSAYSDTEAYSLTRIWNRFSEQMQRVLGWH